MAHSIDLSARHDQMMAEASEWERQAHKFLLEQQHEPAYEAHRKAGLIYSQMKRHDLAGLCFTQAASCWNKHIGQLPLRRAAESHERAALEYLKAGDFQNAKSRFADAALLYERDGDYAQFSKAFYQSKKTERLYYLHAFLNGKGLSGEVSKRITARMGAFGKWLQNVFNTGIWGYGENPFRTFGAAALLILFCAVIYAHFGPIMTHQGPRNIDFGEALYLSVVTFATVGYGDFIPLSFITRCTAVMEGLSGIILAPLFLVALTRKYLRTS